MKHFILLKAIPLIFLSASLMSAGTSIHQPYPGYGLVWSDEFNGTSLNSSNWTYDTGFGDIPGNNDMNGWGVGGLQNYTTNTENVYVSNGMLHLRAIYNGGPRDQRNYTSGKILSRDKHQFCYGIIAARIKFPSGPGIFPAFWLLGTNNYYTNMTWPACGEIDVVELFQGGGIINGALHWFDNKRNKYSSTSGQYQATNLIDFYKDFHIYQIIWTSSVITWKVDNHVFCMAAITPETMAAFRNPMYIIFNFGVGSFFNQVGYPDESTAFPQTMDIDWVRVYQKKNEK